MRRTERICEAAGVGLVEVSSHSPARPDHAAWQGRVFSLHGDATVGGVRYRDLREATGYGTVTGLGGANCRHFFGPWLPGTPRMYEPDPPHPSGLPDDEVYALTQRQRARERSIRAAKRELACAQSAGEKAAETAGGQWSMRDIAEVERLKAKLRGRQKAMRDFIEDANSKGKAPVLRRAPVREWAGDMPRIRKGGTVNRKTEPAPRNAKQAPKPQRPALEFTPAATIEEAQEFASRFIKAGFSKTFKGQAMYKGLSVESANAVNRALAETFGAFDIPKLSGIKVISPTSSQGKKVFKGGADALAAYSFAEGGIFINKEALKTAEAFKRKAKESVDEFDFVIANKGQLSGPRLEIAKRYERAGRSLVDGKTIEGVILHELGHHVDWALISAKGNGIRERMSEFCDRISGYAGSDPREYMAESFVAYMRGELSRLDPEFVAAISSTKKASAAMRPSGTAKLAGIKGELAAKRPKLSKREYAKVVSEINTYYHKRFEGKAMDTIFVEQDDGAYAYTFIINGFDDYIVIGKREIG